MNELAIQLKREKSMLNNFKSCPVCQEQSNQCLHCASYVVDGERIYYWKLKDFGATQDHELRFILRIQRLSTTAFFHKGELYIPSRQGRSVPLAIGLQWQAWQEQQSKVDELQKRVDDLTELNRLKTIALQQSVNRTSPYVHEKIVALEQALKGGIQ